MHPDERIEGLLVDPQSAGQRLDKWLTAALLDLDFAVSRSQVQAWIDEGRLRGPKPKVRANDLVVSGSTYQLRVPEPVPPDLVPEAMALDVVHEDEHVVVVNKPRGMVVHPAAGHPAGTLVNGLLGRGTQLSALGGAARPGVVHRIDKDTSGIVVLAKSDLAYHRLTEQLAGHAMDRLYIAVATGVLDHAEATIEAPIGRDPHHRQRMAVTAAGKAAVTHLRVMARFARHTQLELRLETGRTHQIRVHLAYIGHPLLGDPLYGRPLPDVIAGQALHAATLGFNHPASGERVVFRAPLPQDMAGLLDGLRQEHELPDEPHERR